MSTDGPESSNERPVPFGPFWLERRLAVGGSAEVFLARPTRGLRPAPRFVIKRVLSHSERDDAFRMLVHEAELNQAVSHPNVVEVFGAGQVDGEPYLAMEYVEGVDLFRLLRRCESEQKLLEPAMCAYITAKVASALSAVHSASDSEGRPLEIVHRDVTPSNVYLSNDGDLKLGDFGIARIASPRGRSNQQTAGLKGKFGYLAPEQIAGEPFDHRADLFALTVVFGELLIGERIFPGSGQLAVLLAIRDGNFEPLRKRREVLPQEIYELCMKGLARDPGARFQNASEVKGALEPFIQPDEANLKEQLAVLVRWAADSKQLAQRLKGQIRESVDRMRAVRLAQTSGVPPQIVDIDEGVSMVPAVEPRPVPKAPATDSSPSSERLSANIRLRSGRTLSDVGFPRLVEMLATGELRGDDEVALMGEAMVPIQEIATLSKYLMPSTTATTSRVFPVGLPDYQVQLHDLRFLEILARIRTQADTGALFVERRENDGVQKRKEIYVREGRLLHVASSERDELLGEYLIRRGALERGELEICLNRIATNGGRLGDTLVAMELVDAVDVFRAIRDLGRDRVAALCSWTRGLVTFYRGTAPTHVEFPLDLDLASPMMAGVLVGNQSLGVGAFPSPKSVVVAGSRAPSMASRKERGTVPLALLLVQQLATRQLTVQACIDELTHVRMPKGARNITDREAQAALVVGKVLGWVSFE